MVLAGDNTEDQAVQVCGAWVRRSGAVASWAGGFGPAYGGDELNEDEYIAFLEHKLRKLNFLVATSRGIEQDTREGLDRVLKSDTYLDIEMEGE